MMPQQSRWTVGVLNSFRLERDGVIVAQLYTRKQDLLLAYLALNHETPQLREEIIRIFWPDRSTYLGRSRLSEVLNLLKHECEEAGFPPDTVLVDRYSVRLNPSIGTDLERFEDNFAASLQIGDPAEKVRYLENALAPYGDGLLPGVTRDWIVPERVRLDTVYRQAAKELIETLERLGEAGSLSNLVGRLAPEDVVRYHLRSKSVVPAASARRASGEATRREVAPQR